MEKELILVMQNGDTHVVIGETNIYWKCNGCQFRKANKRILEVREVQRGESSEKPKKLKPPSGKKSESKSQKPKVEESTDE